MRKNRVTKIVFIALGILIPIITILAFGLSDIAGTWNLWGKQSDGPFVYPNWTYSLLVLFKILLYVVPPILIAIGLTKENKKKIEKKPYIYYLLHSLSIWFLVLLVVKLFADSVFELDRIFGLTIFNSIKDIQTLVAFILSVILKRNIKLDTKQIFEKDKTITDGEKEIKKI